MGLVKGSPGWKTQQLAQLLLECNWEAVDPTTCSNMLLGRLVSFFRQALTLNFTSANILVMLSQVNKFRIQDDLADQWHNLICCLTDSNQDSKITNNLLQHVIEDMLEAIPRHVSGMKPPQAKMIAAQPLTKAEEQALHYAIGYIPRRLLKRFRGVKNNAAAAIYLDVIQSWVQIEPDQIGLESDITESEFFIFMKSVELGVRTILNIHNLPELRGLEIVHHLIGILKDNEQVVSAWADLVGSSLLRVGAIEYRVV